MKQFSLRGACGSFCQHHLYFMYFTLSIANFYFVELTFFIPIELFPYIEQTSENNNRTNAHYKIDSVLFLCFFIFFFLQSLYSRIIFGSFYYILVTPRISNALFQRSKVFILFFKNIYFWMSSLFHYNWQLV